MEYINAQVGFGFNIYGGVDSIRVKLPKGSHVREAEDPTLRTFGENDEGELYALHIVVLVPVQNEATKAWEFVKLPINATTFSEGEAIAMKERWSTSKLIPVADQELYLHVSAKMKSGASKPTVEMSLKFAGGMAIAPVSEEEAAAILASMG